jgi:hypothetical protein
VAQTDRWLFAAFDRRLTDDLNLCVSLSRPKRAVMTQCLALMAASCALSLSAVWANLNLAIVLVSACLPLLLVLLASIKHVFQSPQFLWLHPYKPCEISGLDKKNSFSVEITQQWQHFFGLTLRLKILNCPHNKRDTVKMTVWRCKITPVMYRRLRVMVAWRLDQPKAAQKMETA